MTLKKQKTKQKPVEDKPKGKRKEYKDDTCPVCYGTGCVDSYDACGMSIAEVCILCNGSGYYKE